MTRVRADLLLFLAALVWGTAFIAQKHANSAMGSLTFVGARFLLSFLALAPLAIRERNKQRSALGKADIGLACLIGLCLFVGASLQQIGLVTTTATNGGFLTALYVILVPFIVWIITGARPRLAVLAACVVSFTGAWFLTGQGEFQRWAPGDGLLLVADVAWAAAISLVPIFLSRADRPLFLAFAQFGVVAVLALIFGLLVEPFSTKGLIDAAPAILYAGLCSGGVAFTLQIIAQKYTPPAEAALIMSLESVVAAIAGALLLSERLTGLAVFGCALILLGVVLVEVGPAIQTVVLRRPRRWLRKRGPDVGLGNLPPSE